MRTGPPPSGVSQDGVHSRRSLKTHLFVLGRLNTVERVTATETAVGKLNADMTSVQEVTAEVTRWKLMGLGALGVTGMAAAALASLVTAYWSDIWRVLKGG